MATYKPLYYNIFKLGTEIKEIGAAGEMKPIARLESKTRATYLRFG